MLENKTKKELIRIIENQEEKIKELEDDVDYWQNEWNYADAKIDDLNLKIRDLEDYDTNNIIKNLDFFKEKLKIENYSLFKQIEEFLDVYLKYYND